MKVFEPNNAHFVSRSPPICRLTSCFSCKEFATWWSFTQLTSSIVLLGQFTDHKWQTSVYQASQNALLNGDPWDLEVLSAKSGPPPALETGALWWSLPAVPLPVQSSVRGPAVPHRKTFHPLFLLSLLCSFKLSQNQFQTDLSQANWLEFRLLMLREFSLQSTGKLTLPFAVFLHCMSPGSVLHVLNF